MTANKFNYIDQNGIVTEAEVMVSVYKKNHGICIELKDKDKVFKITKNLDSNVFDYGNYVDVVKYPLLASAMLQNDLGYFLPGGVVEKDDVKYPFFIFNKERLKQLDPVGVAKYEEILALDEVFTAEKQMNETITASMDEICIFGKPALLASSGFDKNTLPEGLFAYDIKGAASSTDGLPHLEVSVTDNKCGTVVLFDKMDMPSDGYLPIDEEDLVFVNNGCQNVKDFCEKHGVGRNADFVIRKNRTK